LRFVEPSLSGIQLFYLQMLPIFFSEELVTEVNGQIVLEEDASKHIVQVLRMRTGDELQLTNGKGVLCTTAIINDKKKAVQVEVKRYEKVEASLKKNSICLSLLKNVNRFEWFLEKATELGIGELIPMICERTERQHFRASRMKNILVSAMLQSRQSWLPILQDPTSFNEIIVSSKNDQKFIAHCIEQEKTNLPQAIDASSLSRIMLIGPEGDFTQREVAFAIEHGFVATSLGETRLRSETAAMVAATLMQLS